MRRPSPVPREARGFPRVIIHAAPDLRRAAQRALLADGLDSGGADDEPGDDTAPVVVVAGRLAAPISRQRREALAAVERHAPRRVVLVTDIEQRGSLRRLLGTGVHGLVVRYELEAALGPAVRAVAAGQLCVTERARAAVIRRPLTAREREILALVIMGQTNGEIARRLHLAESTVKTHLAAIFAKLGVSSRAEAAELVADPQEMLSKGVVGLLSGAAEGRA
jgi:DNA-binding NarL/FixJ family response regulator